MSNLSLLIIVIDIKSSVYKSSKYYWLDEGFE